MKKNIRQMDKPPFDDEIAVLISGGYGAGWSTGGLPEEAIFDPGLVHLVEKLEEFQKLDVSSSKIEELNDQILSYCTLKWGDEYAFGGIDDLEIRWIPVGTKFSINEYDGSESIITEHDLEYVA